MHDSGADADRADADDDADVDSQPDLIDASDEDVAPDGTEDGVADETEDEADSADVPAACTTDEDCDDDNPCTSEVCDGTTGECVREILGGLTWGPEDVRVTASAWNDRDNRVPVEWTGSEVLLVWRDELDANPESYEVYLTRLTADGARVAPDVVLVDTAAYPSPSDLEWNGSTLGMTWDDSRGAPPGAYFTVFGLDGEVIVPAFQLNSADRLGQGAKIAWTGSDYLVVWYDGDGGSHGNLKLARIAADGTVLSEAEVSSGDATAMAQNFRIAWTGTELGVFWPQGNDAPNDIHFARMSATGERLGTELTLTSGPGVKLPGVVWTGSEYGLAWLVDYRAPEPGPELHFARFGPDGSRRGADLPLEFDVPPWEDAANTPDILWAGSEFWVLWDTMANRGYYSIVSADGTANSPSASLDWSSTIELSACWADGVAGVVWTDFRFGDPTRGELDILYNTLSRSCD